MIKEELYNKNFLVIGDVMLDQYLYGATKRISQEAPVPVVHFKSYESKLGGAGNVAVNLLGLGVNVDLIGVVGGDDAGREVINLTKSYKIGGELKKIKNHPTIKKCRIVSQGHQLVRIDYEDTNTSFNLHSTFKRLLSKKKYSGIIVSDYNKGALVEVRKIISTANQQKIPIIVDPKGNDFLKYRNASAITPNLSEFENIVGKVNSEKDLHNKAFKLLSDLRLKHLVITRGETGVTLFGNNLIHKHFPAQAKEVFDVTGAGDTFIAYFSVIFCLFGMVEDSINIANHAAALAVEKSGTSQIMISDLELRYKDIFNKLNLADNSLTSRVNNLKSLNKKIVFTNGCFDILHPGHIDLLKQAKLLGDFLIVGLNSDSSVKMLKGKLRPINSQNNRKILLESLGCVDLVVIFSERSPLKLIKSIKPDVLVKGGDYKTQEIIGYEQVLTYGGKVKTIRYKKDFSTSKIINKIKGAKDYCGSFYLN